MIAKLVNLALLGLFPLAWTAPLVSTEIAWLLTIEEISILSGVRQLWDVDPALCVVIALFAIVTPFVKTVALVYVQFSDRDDARRLLPLLEVIGRLSMVDVFLIALSILVYRGVGEVRVEWGFYLFAVLVLLSMWSAWATMQARYRRVPIEDLGADARRARDEDAAHG